MGDEESLPAPRPELFRNSLRASCRDDAAVLEGMQGQRQGEDASPRRGAALAPLSRSQLCCHRNIPRLLLHLSAGAPRSAPPEPGNRPAEPHVSVPPSGGGFYPLAGQVRAVGAPAAAVAGLLPPARRASRCANELAGSINCMRSTFGCSAC